MLYQPNALHCAGLTWVENKMCFQWRSEVFGSIYMSMAHKYAPEPLCPFLQISKQKLTYAKNLHDGLSNFFVNSSSVPPGPQRGRIISTVSSQPQQKSQWKYPGPWHLPSIMNSSHVFTNPESMKPEFVPWNLLFVLICSKWIIF
jgi:hypothetical protein